MANIIKGIDYARNNGARIMNNSWGGGSGTPELLAAIQETQKAGVLFVASAGNSGRDNDIRPAFPASYQVDNIISVAAVNNRGDVWDSSNFGATSVHIGAPGVNIYSTGLVSEGFIYLSGTSMAAPFVTGAAALLLADNPHLTYREIKQRLLSSARPLHSLTGKTITGGILDVSYALLGGTPPPDPNDVTSWPGRTPESVSTPIPNGDKFDHTYTITVPGALRLAVHFSKFKTYNRFNTVSVFNKMGDLVGILSGLRDDTYSPLVDGDTIVLKVFFGGSGNGFDIDSAVFE